MEEVPGSEESLLALDEQPALTGQNEEGLLIRLGVVNAALAGLEDGHIDPELRELDRRLAVLVGEPTCSAPRLRREPLGVAHVDDKPTLRDGGKPGASVLKPRFVHAADSRSPSDGWLVCASVLSPELRRSELIRTLPTRWPRRGWSINGAERSQPIATGGKWNGAESGSDTRKPLPSVATGCRRNAMVRNAMKKGLPDDRLR